MGPPRFNKAQLLIRIRDEGRRRFQYSPLDAYRTRLMLGLGLSLALVYAGFHLPIPQADGTAWHLVDQFDPLYLQTDPPETTTGKTGGIATDFEPPKGLIHQTGGSGLAHQGNAVDASGEGEDTDGTERPLNTRRIAPKKIFQFSEEPPTIPGGIRALYLNITYPEEALEAGIQGRVILTFVVEPDGSTSQIEVQQALHTSCDSAAVRAVRETRFIPGYQSGQPVRVRMHLPIRFQIITEEDSTAQPPATL